MLLLLFSLSPTVRSLFVNAQDTVPDNQALDTTPLASCDDDDRSPTSIAWGCLAVLFACTWLSIHPNVPSATDTSFAIVRRKLSIMFAALLAPELVLCWAMRQWVGSRLIARKYRGNAPEWTTVHAYFLLMGGFVISRDDESDLVQLLPPLEFDRVYQAGGIEFPNIPSKVIQDRSKADWLAKGLAVLQTAWFLVQSIARGVTSTRLSSSSSEPKETATQLTELEVLTLALASLNAAMYFFWWDKPLDVQCPVVLSLKTDIDTAQNQPQSQDHAPQFHDPALAPTSFPNAPSPKLPRKKLSIKARALISTSNTVRRVYSLLLELIQTPWVMMNCRDMHIPNQPTRMPTFYAPHMDRFHHAVVLSFTSLLGVGFGGIHFVAWNIATPTRTELMLWRIATIHVTATFFFAFVLSLHLVYEVVIVEKKKKLPVAKAEGEGKAENRADGNVTAHPEKQKIPLAGVVKIAFGLLQYANIPIYILSRTLLFALAFTTLRDLPPSATRSIEWTEYFPHFG